MVFSVLRSCKKYKKKLYSDGQQKNPKSFCKKHLTDVRPCGILHTVREIQRKEVEKMRKHTARNVVVVTVVVAVALLVVGRVGYWQTHYNRNGIVTSVEGEVVTVTDTTGNEWAVAGEPLSVGDKVTLHMHTQGTDNVITDDTVVSVSIR